MIQKGTKVLHKKTRRIAYIVAVYDDIKGGVVLDRYLDGFRSWNVEDLKILEG